MPRQRLFHRRAARAIPTTLALLALLAAGPARAGCTLAFPQGRVDLGSRTPSTLADSDVAGYRLLGSATPVLSGICTQAPSRVRIAVQSLPPAPGGNLQWPGSRQRATALRLSVVQASVGAGAVPFGWSGGTEPPGTAPLLLDHDGVLELDLAGLPPDADRRVFSLQLQVLGLVPAAYATPTAESFSLSPRFTWVP